METAGRAVVFSGTAVAIGLALMLFMPVPFMRGFGLAGLIIPLVSVLAAVTLLPVLMYWLEDRLDRVRFIPRRIQERRADPVNSFWPRLARWIMKRPARVAGATIAALLLAALPILKIQLTPGLEHGRPAGHPGREGPERARGGDRRGRDRADGRRRSTPGRAGGVADPRVRAAIQRLAVGLRNDPEVTDVVWRQGAELRRLERAATSTCPRSAGTTTACRRARSSSTGCATTSFPRQPSRAASTVLAGGGPPGGVDFLDMTYGAFPWLVLAVLLFTYVLLVRAFRSILLPLKAIVMNLLSIGAAYGLLVLAFKFGLGEPFGLQQFDQIEGWIPVFLFAMLFGLSMDYEVFLVSRMREEWDAPARQRGGRGDRAREDRAARDGGRDHHVRRVHGLRRRLARRAPAVRLRARGGDHHRRHGDPGAARAERDEDVRALELVAARASRPDRAGRALDAPFEGLDAAGDATGREIVQLPLRMQSAARSIP